MWTVLEIDQNLLNIFRKDFKKNTSSEAEIYCPKYLVQHFRKNKLKFKEIKLLNNYIFCFNSNFKNSNFLNTIKYLKGFKSCVPGYLNTQKEIIRYINTCKKSEDKFGYIKSEFFNINPKNNYRLKSGVFTNKIFEIMKFQKNKIEIMIGNLRVSTKKKNFIAHPI
jgi:hypothetical protein